MSPLTRDSEQGDEPFNDLTRIANDLLEAAGAVPEHVRVVVIVNTDEKGGIGGMNYEDTSAMLGDLMGACESLGRATGVAVSFIPIENPGQG